MSAVVSVVETTRPDHNSDADPRTFLVEMSDSQAAAVQVAAALGIRVGEPRSPGSDFRAARLNLTQRAGDARRWDVRVDYRA